MAGFTVDERRALVEDYLRVPFGSKGTWLEDRGVSFWQMYRWRKAYAGGDLDRGLYPREASDVSQNLAEIKRLHRLLEEERQAHEKTRAQVAKYEATVESLGKAIELLHAHSGVGQAVTTTISTFNHN